MYTITYTLPCGSGRTIGGLTEQSEIEYEKSKAKKDGASSLDIHYYEGGQIKTDTIKL